MSRRARSVHQRVGNRGSERRLSRADAFVAYAMDRMLFRLGRSHHSAGWVLKGGVLAADLVGIPHRFTRDVDLLRRGPLRSATEVRELLAEVLGAGPTTAWSSLSTG